MSHVLSLQTVVGLKSEPCRAFWRANLGQAVLIPGPFKETFLWKIVIFKKLYILHVSIHIYRNSELD